MLILWMHVKVKERFTKNGHLDDLETPGWPCFSIDDTRIITVAVKLVELIKSDHIDKHLQTTKYELELQEFN